MADRVLGVGVVGCGVGATQWHLPALALVPGLEVVAVADVAGAARQRAARLAGLDRGHPDHESLLAHPRVDVVAVCVPAAHHVEVATAAFDAGRHVLVEKPPALGLAEWDELLVAARRAGTSSLLGTNMRRLPAVRRARAAIASGRLGEIRAVHTMLTSDRTRERAESAWRAHRSLGGGALLEKAVHHVDLWRYLLGCEVDTVSARTSEGDRDVALTATMEDRTQAVTTASEHAFPTNTLMLVGTQGRLELELDRAAGVRDRVRARRVGGAYLGSFVSEWLHLAEAIRGGRAPEPSLESGRALMQTLLAAAASASTGAAVRRVDAPVTLAQ